MYGEATDKAEAHDKRQHDRMSVLYSGTLFQDKVAIDCVIKDISVSGAQIVAERAIRRDAELVLDIDRAGLFPVKAVWQQDRRLGMQFLTDPDTVARRIGTAWGL